MTSVCSLPSRVNFGIILSSQKSRWSFHCPLLLKRSCPLKGIRPFVEGVCVAAEDQGSGSLETAPVHDSPTENIRFAFLAVNSLMRVCPRNLLPARTNTCVVVDSVLSRQKPCFAPHVFQPDSKPWASFPVTSSCHRGSCSASTCEHRCGRSQFPRADAGRCPRLQ